MAQTFSRRSFVGLLGGAAFATGIAFASGRPAVRSAAALTFISGTPEATPELVPLLRLEYTGGFVPVEYTLTAIPAFTLYPDGRVITVGPMIEIFPQPALPNLREMTLSASGIERVLAEARKAGLFDGSASYDLPGIADVQTTMFILKADGVSSIVSAYALGFDESVNMEVPDAEARAKLNELQNFLFNLQFELTADDFTTTDQPYVSAAIRIFTRPIDEASPPWQDVMPEPEAMDWPIATPLSDMGIPYEGPYGEGVRCNAFIGEDAAKITAALAGANQLTPWRSVEKLYQLWARPLLPEESGCSSIVPDVG